MKQILPLAGIVAFCAALSAAAQPAFYTNSLTADAFVRAAAPASNFGGAGAVSVSGATATNAVGTANGVFDGFLRLNTAAMAGSLDAAFGGTTWEISAVTLTVTEQATPNLASFNRGAGLFEIRWIANDSWAEGTGSASFPTMNGVTHNDVSGLLNAGTDVTLGTFASAGTDGSQSFSLNLPAAFINDLRGAGDVSLYLTAVSPQTGFTFTSRTGGNGPRPALVVTAVPEPGAWALLAVGAGAMALGFVRRR